MEIAWETDLEAALARARKERKPVFLEFIKDPCPECDRLNADTFSDPRVQAEITGRFIPLRLNLRRDRDAVRRYNLFWTPTLYFLDPHGEARAESVGYLPPDELLPLLDYGEAHVVLRRGKFLRAAELFDLLVERYPTSGLAAEALYWAANVHYLITGDEAVLTAKRAELVERYPDSFAAKRVKPLLEG
ncbi:MAG TPA: thioredoxin family protein [Longimicrobiales bacterium]